LSLQHYAVVLEKRRRTCPGLAPGFLCGHAPPTQIDRSRFLSALIAASIRARHGYGWRNATNARTDTRSDVQEFLGDPARDRSALGSKTI